MERKILVTVDGSLYSSNALRYIGQLFGGVAEMQFHLLSIVPCNVAPAGREWMEEEDLLNALSPESRNKYSSQKRYLKQAILQLANYGVSAEQVTTSVHLSRMGIAKDIMHMGRTGLYDAILVGRRGISKLEELFMGSVSATLVDQCHDVPLWIIDGKVDSRTFLVPVDGSFYCLKAVDHLAHVLKNNSHAEIALFNSAAMLADKSTNPPEQFYELLGKQWCEEHLTREDSLFHAPKQLLLDNGFPEERIHWLQTFKGLYPSRQILRQALIDDFGTIVLGRSESTIRKGLFKSTTDQVLYMADQVAVWIIG